MLPETTSGPSALGDEWTVLVAGEDLARVDAFVSPLRRAAYSVRRAVSALAAGKIIKERPFDLIVLVLPLASASTLLNAIRKEGSLTTRTGVLVVTEESTTAEESLGYTERANKTLPHFAGPEDLLSVAQLLLRAAPRVPLKAAARIQVGAQPWRVRLDNISTTGMFFTAPEAPEINVPFPFEIGLSAKEPAVRGQARAVRFVPTKDGIGIGVGAEFISFGGDGAKRIEAAIFQERAAAGATEWRTGPHSVKGGGTLFIRDEDELQQRKEELTELEPLLDGLLKQGLVPRVQAADWYVAAAELGLESLTTFAGILEGLHGGAAKRSEVSQQLTDLNDVRRFLEQLTDPHRELAVLVRILIEMRRPLERLLRALALTGGDADQSGGGRPKGVVAEISADVQRLLRYRKVLRQLPGQIRELGRVQYLFARSKLRRRAAEISTEFATVAPEIGLDERRLRSRRRRREMLHAVDRELGKLDKRITTVHERVYSGRMKQQASGSQETDLAEGKLIPVIVDTLADGSAFLVRAYSAYKHALELTGTDPRLVDRVAGLSAAVTAAEARFERLKARGPSRPAAH